MSADRMTDEDLNSAVNQDALSTVAAEARRAREAEAKAVRHGTEEEALRWAAEAKLAALEKARDPHGLAGRLSVALRERDEARTERDQAFANQKAAWTQTEKVTAENAALRARVERYRDVLTRIAGNLPGADPYVRARAALRDEPAETHRPIETIGPEPHVDPFSLPSYRCKQCHTCVDGEEECPMCGCDSYELRPAAPAETKGGANG